VQGCSDKRGGEDKAAGFHAAVYTASRPYGQAVRFAP